jgi:hypothetical protein
MQYDIQYQKYKNNTGPAGHGQSEDEQFRCSLVAVSVVVISLPALPETQKKEHPRNAFLDVLSVWFLDVGSKASA